MGIVLCIQVRKMSSIKGSIDQVMNSKSAFFYTTFFSFLLFPFLPAPSFSQAAEYSISSDTIIRVFERDTADKKDALVNPVYEYLQVDIGNKGVAGV